MVQKKKKIEGSYINERGEVCDFQGVCRVPGEPMEEAMGTDLQVRRLSDLSWRIFKIMGEFVNGFQFLSAFSREVTVFGSARLEPGTKWYLEAEKFGYLCGKAGFTMITGGGPGVMEAANKGAFKSGGESIGINIQLPFEQRINPYVKKSAAFNYFFTRKVMLAASAQAYIFFPGGFGTADEFFEMVTLIQTKKVAPVPVICVGREFWEPCLHWMNQMEKMGTISKEEKKIFNVVDTAEDAMKIVSKSKERTIF
jgi:uncharacterized protein (TIGR00730 family)